MKNRLAGISERPDHARGGFDHHVRRQGRRDDQQEGQHCSRRTQHIAPAPSGRVSLRAVVVVMTGRLADEKRRLGPSTMDEPSWFDTIEGSGSDDGDLHVRGDRFVQLHADGVAAQRP